MNFAIAPSIDRKRFWRNLYKVTEMGHGDDFLERLDYEEKRSIAPYRCCRQKRSLQVFRLNAELISETFSASVNIHGIGLTLESSCA